MKPPLHTPAHRARQALAFGLAAMLTVSPAFGQTADSDALRRLQEENAALRKRLAEVEGAKPAQPAPAAQTGQSATATQPSMAADPVDKDTLVLSPFQVTSDKDYGYLKTNSSTATRIGMDIQRIPLNVSVISEEFIRDTNMQDIQDVLRYQSSSAGDGRMGILQPATGFTPSGNMSLRGFPINSRLRNGLLRYNAYNLDNIDRVEVIKGPAAIFFGNAFPGGVINYVTKQPSFSKIPTAISFQYSGGDTRYGGERVTLDNNTVLSDKAALRIVGAWDNRIGDAKFEYQKGYSVNVGLALDPLKSHRLKIFIEGEVLQRLRNQDDDSWRWPAQWFADYKNPPANLIAISGVADAAAYRARILNGLGTWIADVRNAANDQYIPLWTQPLEHGAYYTDKAGNVIHDETFNYYGMGSYSKDQNSTFSVVTDFAATDWLDIRHSYTTVQSSFDRVISAANPYADQMRFSTIGVTLQGYDIDAYYHQLDLVFKKKLWDIDNKFLAGGFYGQTYNSFTGSVGANAAGTTQFPFFGNLPGAFDKPDEGYVSPIPVALRNTTFGANIAQEFIRNRTGQILTPMEIFSLYDPGVHISPDIRRIAEISRGLVDHSRPKRKEWYLNWQATSMNDRLTTFLGYRQEEITTPGQLVAVNPPWFIVPDDALNVIPRDEWVKYGLNEVFSRARKVKGTSKMAGVSFELTKNLNVYASYSQTFLPSGVQYLGGDTDPTAVRTRATLLGLNPDTEYARVLSEGFLKEIPNEKGKNIELGVKLSTDDNKWVGTLSVYRVTRENRNVDDTQKQFDEPLNYLLPNKQGAANRVLRWFTASATQETEGAEFDLTWTPKRNYQAVFSGGWMWRAETVKDPSLNILPNSPASLTISRNIIFGNRLAYAPEFRFNVWNKYTFDHDFIGGFGNGLGIGLGARYASEIIISNDQNFNAARGGLTAGNYVVFQTNITYPFEVYGYKMTAGLNIDNLTDKEYSEGNFSLAAPRSWVFTLGMKF